MLIVGGETCFPVQLFHSTLLENIYFTLVVC